MPIFETAKRANPSGLRGVSSPSQIRAQKIRKDGQDYYVVSGYATVFNRGYTMEDKFGSYTEIVDSRALDASLAAYPDMAFLFGHNGLSMARTTNGSLSLSADATGLKIGATLNAARSDVQTLVAAIEDGDITEMSFGFRIVDGQWNSDMSEFRITEIDLNRGDVSAVNYGANPWTSLNVGSAVGADDYGSLDDWLTGDVPSSAGVAKSAPAPVPPAGRSVASWRTQLDDGELSGPGVGYEGTLGMWRMTEVQAAEDYAALVSEIRSRRRAASTAEGYELESLRLQVELAQIRQRDIIAFANDLMGH